MEVAPCIVYSKGKLNYSGKTLILGHNYGKIFGSNTKLQIGDKIYITTLDGKKVEYTIYNKTRLNVEDVSYLTGENAKPEVFLSTCTENDNIRLVIMARVSV